MDELVQKAAEYLKEKSQITVFTGAGISAESGISTYRDGEDSLWNNYDPMTFATIIGFLSDPVTAWKWYKHRRDTMRQAKPNPAHLSVAKLQKLKPSTAIITQNIDNLHERAGSQTINHLHGDMFATHCIANCQGTPTVVSEFDETNATPRCPHCDNHLRPGVVWFGEALPVSAVRSMRECVAETDLLFVIGLSGAITYGIPEFVKVANKGIVIEVNPNESEITQHADVFLPAPAGEILPKIIAKLEALL